MPCIYGLLWGLRGGGGPGQCMPACTFHPCASSYGCRQSQAVSMFAVKASWWSPQGRGGVCKPRQPSRAIWGSTCPIDCALPHPIPAHPHTPATPQSASWEEVLLQGMCWEGVLCAGTTAHYIWTECCCLVLERGVVVQQHSRCCSWRCQAVAHAKDQAQVVSQSS